jgi:cellobiose phosphorylase
MTRTTILLMVLCAAVSVTAQTTNAGQSSSANQQHAKKSKDEITVRGCVSKLSTDYILTQPDQGNSYELQGSKKLRFGPYLGQQVEVTGTEAPSMATSSDYSARAGSPSPVTITVNSIKTIAKRCSAY